MATLKYAAYGTAVAIAGNTELASLANGQGVWANGGGLTSNVWDNTTLKYPEADFMLLLGSIAAAAGASMILALLWSADSTNYPDPQYASGQSPNHVPLAGTPTYTQSLLVSTSAKIVFFPAVKLRPGKAKFIIHNLSGVALNASNNSLTMYPATFDIS